MVVFRLKRKHIMARQVKYELIHDEASMRHIHSMRL